MPRPTGPCAKCLREMPPGWEACEHLKNCYDKYAMKTFGGGLVTAEQIQQMEQELVDYALNRMLALDRDNGNKLQGIQASRIYKSRNTKTSELLSNKCHVRRGPVQCMRNAGHPTNDLNEMGSHRF